MTKEHKKFLIAYLKHSWTIILLLIIIPAFTVCIAIDTPAKYQQGVMAAILVSALVCVGILSGLVEDYYWGYLELKKGNKDKGKVAN